MFGSDSFLMKFGRRLAERNWKDVQRVRAQTKQDNDEIDAIFAEIRTVALKRSGLSDAEGTEQDFEPFPLQRACSGVPTELVCLAH